MKDDLTEFQSSLQSLAAEKLSPVGTHRTPDELAAYHFHQLSAEEEDQIQDHLVSCRACTMSLLDLAELCATKLATESVPASLAPPTEAQAPASASFFQRLRAQFFPFRLIPALVVLSLLLSLSLGAWVLSLQRTKQTLLVQLTQQQTAREGATAKEIADAQQQRDEARLQAQQLATDLEKARHEKDELGKTQLNPPIIDLPLSAMRTRGTTPPASPAQPPTITVAKGTVRFTVIIPAVAVEKTFPDYVLEILAPNGKSIVEEKGLTLDPTSGFRVSLPSQSYPAGDYRFTIYGLGRGSKVKVISDVVRIRYQ